MNCWDFYALYALDQMETFLQLDMGWLMAADDVWEQYGMDAAIVFLVGA